jgi:hypothetical protein
MGFLDSLFGWGGEDPEAIRQRERGYAAQQAEREAALAREQQQMQINYLNQIRQDDLAREAAAAAKDPTATRSAAMSNVAQFFTPEYQTGWLPDTLTDPLETQVYGEERAKADEYLNRLLKRGVITETGKAAAAANLESQGARVRSQLNDISNMLLGAEREKLAGYEGRAKQRASSLGVGESFDPTPFYTGAQTELGTFTSGIGDLYRSQIPTDLFDTASLGSIAGGAQFAGNRPFDPDITPGTTYTPSDETDPFSGQKPVQKRTSTVF